MEKINDKVFDKFPVLKSDRLTMRQIEAEDAKEIYIMRTNTHVNRFIARPDIGEYKNAEELVSKTNQAYTNKQGIGWAGILREDNTCIGTCGFNGIDYPNLRAEIGGEMNTAYWGKGIAIEAVELIINFGFEVMNLHSIEAKVQPGNRGAIYLLEALGFEKEAHFKHRVYYKEEWLDLCTYSKVNL